MANITESYSFRLDPKAKASAQEIYGHYGISLAVQ